METKTRNIVIGVVAVVILLIIIGYVAGWFGGKKEASAPPPTTTTEQPAPAQPSTTNQGTTTTQPSPTEPSKTFKSDMKGASEVPPTSSGGEANAMVTLDTTTKKLTWKITYSGLTGEPTAAHFHGPAAPGANAGPVVDISGKIAEGSADLTDAQIADLQAGRWYLNIHTAKFPDGEVRGQVEPSKQ